jgi:hypothetical protein
LGNFQNPELEQSVLWIWIRIGVNADPDPAFYLNADPDPYPGSQTNAGRIRILTRLESQKVYTKNILNTGIRSNNIGIL